MSRSLGAGLTLLVVASVALAALEIYQAFWNAPELRQDREALAHMVEVVTTARGLEMAVRDAERAQFSSLITHDALQLAARRTRAVEALQLLAKLKTLTAGDPAQQARIPQLEQDVNNKLAQIELIAQQPDSEGPDAAMQLVRADLSADTMANIRAEIKDIAGAEEARLRQRQASASQTERLSASTAGSAAALALALIVIGAALTQHSFARMLRSERALQDSEEQLRLLVSGVTDYAIYLLDPRGHITTWNTGARRIKGYDAEEVIGQHFSRFYTQEDREADMPRKVLETAAREGRYEAEGWRVRKDGSRFWASVIVDAVHDPTGKLMGFAKVTRDITERQEREMELARVREILAQSQKMDALGQLTGGIAHDINNVLTVIRNALDALQRRLRAGEREVGRYADAIGRGTDRATGLTRQLLAFARRQALAPRALDTNKLVAGMADMLGRTLPEGIALETALAGGLWWTEVDPGQLESAILNLALNAKDAMPDGGKLTIETANAFLDGTYAAKHAEVAPGQYVMIAVSDTGAGMSKDVASRAFEPFFTTKDVGRGTGLGLSQVYGFVKQSHGHVKIYSEPGAGTTVKVYLPRLDKPPLSQSAAEVKAPATRKAEESILLVEDDQEVREFTTESLGELGYRVFAASDGHAALRTLETQTDIDLLFTDVGLPNGMNGRALADEARIRRPGIKVLFTTGYAPNAIVHHGRLDSGVDLITKPYTQSELAQIVRTVLDR